MLNGVSTRATKGTSLLPLFGFFQGCRPFQERNGTERSSERNGTERRGSGEAAERNGTERILGGTERNGTDFGVLKM